MANEEFALGDLVWWRRDGEGVVVGIIERNEFSPPLDAHRWQALNRGVLVRSPDGQLQHFRDASTVLTRRPSADAARGASGYSPNGTYENR